MDGAAVDFQAVHAAFRARIQRYLTRLVGEFEAEDLTQEVFVRVNRSLGSFRGEAGLSTWVYRIATNAALDRLRSPAFKQIAADELPDLSDLDAGLEQDIFAEEAAPSLEELLFLKQRYECYCDFIDGLPVNYRVIVALSELEDLAVSEIADILGLSVEVVKIRLHRGRKKLIEALRAHCKPEDWL